MSLLPAKQMLGLATIVGRKRPLDEVLEVAAAVGLDGVEITGRPPHLASNATVSEVASARRATEERGLEVLAYGSYVGFESAFGLGDAETAVSIARDLGTTRLRVWAESPTGAFDDEAFGDVVALLQHCSDAAAANRIEVVLERHRHSFADSITNVKRLLTAVGRPNFSLNYQALDHLAATAAATLPDDARQLAPQATYFHLKNYSVLDSASPTLELGAPLRSGALDYTAVLTAAFGAGYEGPLVLEFTSDDASASLETRVRDDITFLRGL